MPPLLRETKVDVTKCHTCHAKTKMDFTKCHACHAKWHGAPGDPARPTAPPEPAQCPKCQEGGCHQAPRLPRKWLRATERAQARHQSQPSAASTTPATRNQGGRHQVARLPRKVVRRPGRPSVPKRARANPVPQVPRLPHKMQVNVAKCHACDAQYRGKVFVKDGV